MAIRAVGRFYVLVAELTGDVINRDSFREQVGGIRMAKAVRMKVQRDRGAFEYPEHTIAHGRLVKRFSVAVEHPFSLYRETLELTDRPWQKACPAKDGSVESSV